MSDTPYRFTVTADDDGLRVETRSLDGETETEIRIRPDPGAAPRGTDWPERIVNDAYSHSADPAGEMRTVLFAATRAAAERHVDEVVAVNLGPEGPGGDPIDRATTVDALVVPAGVDAEGIEGVRSTRSVRPGESLPVVVDAESVTVGRAAEVSSDGAAEEERGGRGAR